MAQTYRPLAQCYLWLYTAIGYFKDAQDAATSATTTGYTAQAGDVKYKDLNGDHIINQFDVSAIGGNRPLVYYGLSSGFNYKGFSLSFLLQGVANRELMFNNSQVNGFAGVGFLGLTYSGQAYETILGRWTPETAATATAPRLITWVTPTTLLTQRCTCAKVIM
jgi:hypothetical protein